MKLKQIFGIVGIGMIAIFLMNGCTSMSSLQTAQTLEPGEKEFGGGAGYISFRTVIDTGTIKVPIFELWGRYGLAENLDCGGKVYTIGSITDIKYRLLKSNYRNPIALAIGGGVSYFTLTVSSMGIETKNNIIDLHFPFYISYHLGKDFALYGTPKYILRINNWKATYKDEKGKLKEESGTKLGHFTGGTIGTAIGSKFCFLAEVSFLYGFLEKAPVLQFTGGIAMKFGEKKTRGDYYGDIGMKERKKEEKQEIKTRKKRRKRSRRRSRRG